MGCFLAGKREGEVLRCFCFRSFFFVVEGARVRIGWKLKVMVAGVFRILIYWGLSVNVYVNKRLYSLKIISRCKQVDNDVTNFRKHTMTEKKYEKFLCCLVN